MKPIYLLCALVLFSLHAQAPVPAPKKNDADPAIRRINERTAAYINAGQIAEFVDLYFAPDAVWLGRERAAIRGREAIGAFFKAGFSAAPINISIEVEKIEQSGDLAYEIGHEVITVTDKDGAKKQHRGKYVAVWKRQPNGDWRCVVDVPSSEPGE